jgi:hypothetical protein
MVTKSTRPPVVAPTTWGHSKDNYWVEYPSGLIDLSRSNPITTTGSSDVKKPEIKKGEYEFNVLNDRRLRIDPEKSAVVIIDMQK